MHKLLFVRNRFKRARTERLNRERSFTKSTLFTYHSVRVTENALQSNARFQNPDFRYLLVSRIWSNTKRGFHISILFCKISHKTLYAGLTFSLSNDPGKKGSNFFCCGANNSLQTIAKKCLQFYMIRTYDFCVT